MHRDDSTRPLLQQLAMPFVGSIVSVDVVSVPGGSAVTLLNRSGSRRRFEVAGQVVVVDGNTTAGLVVDSPLEAVVVMENGDRVWPPLHSSA